MIKADGHIDKLEAHAKTQLIAGARKIIDMLDFPVQVPGKVEAELVLMIKHGIQLYGKSFFKSIWNWVTTGSMRQPDKIMFQLTWESLVGKALADPGICDDCPNRGIESHLKSAVCKPCDEKAVEYLGEKILRESTFPLKSTLPVKNAANGRVAN